MNTENYNNAEKVLVHIKDMIAKENDQVRKIKLEKAAELMQWACAYIAHDRNDDAGRKLLAAKRILAEVVA